MARKVCPEGHEGTLYSVEKVIAHYPVTVDENNEIDYTGEEAFTFDECAAPTGQIHCSECGEDYDRTDLIVPHPEHDECADGCGLDVDHEGACLDRPGGRQVCQHEEG